MVKIMYAQQYRQPPKDYGGTAIQPKEQNKEPEEPEASPAPPRLLSSFGTDEEKRACDNGAYIYSAIISFPVCISKHIESL